MKYELMTIAGVLILVSCVLVKYKVRVNYEPRAGWRVSVRSRTERSMPEANVTDSSAMMPTKNPAQTVGLSVKADQATQS